MKPEEPTQDSIQSSCQAIPITDIQRQYGYNKSLYTERMKSVDFFLNKRGTETLQSFNLKVIL